MNNAKYFFLKIKVHFKNLCQIILFAKYLSYPHFSLFKISFLFKSIFFVYFFQFFLDLFIILLFAMLHVFLIFYLKILEIINMFIIQFSYGSFQIFNFLFIFFACSINACSCFSFNYISLAFVSSLKLLNSHFSSSTILLLLRIVSFINSMLGIISLLESGSLLIICKSVV